MSAGEHSFADDCASGLWPREDESIERWTAALNRAESARDKVAPAQALMEASERLLRCESHDEDRESCRFCHEIAQVRYRTAGLVVRVGQLRDS